MGSKRKFVALDEDEDHPTLNVSNKKHTLDSDEEDSDDYEKDELQDGDIEGEEEGVADEQDEVKITPFNMREELEEGHFDKDGHYHWNKDSDIKDHWLDNIDWVKVKKDKNTLDPSKNDDSNDSDVAIFSEHAAYAQMVTYMKPMETVQRTLQRLGKERVKISSAERLRRKKLGIVDAASEKITRFTELTNQILTRTGNMDIYQETYECIKSKLCGRPSGSKGINQNANSSSDMYADDFEEKEKAALESTEPKVSEPAGQQLRWEYKWKQNDADSKVEGPYTTQQMLQWTQEKRFKEGVYVRKVGELTNFYSSNRIDFDLYL